MQSDVPAQCSAKNNIGLVRTQDQQVIQFIVLRIAVIIEIARWTHRKAFQGSAVGQGHVGKGYDRRGSGEWIGRVAAINEIDLSRAGGRGLQHSKISASIAVNVAHPGDTRTGPGRAGQQHVGIAHGENGPYHHIVEIPAFQIVARRINRIEIKTNADVLPHELCQVQAHLAPAAARVHEPALIRQNHR